jgi:hypothetical protein
MSTHNTYPFPRARVSEAVTTERDRQIIEARRMEGGAAVRPTIRPKTSAKPGPKGHEALLKGLEASGAQVEVMLRDVDVPKRGIVKRSDSYTISLETTLPNGSTVTDVLFKHAMIGFRVTTPRPLKEEGTDALGA